MNKNKILTIVSIIVIIISIIALVIIVVNNKEEDFVIDGINLPSNKEILKDTTIDDLKITNISLLTREEISTYKATVINETNKDIEIDVLYVIFYENDVENKIIALYDTKILANQKRYIDITSEKDLSNTTKIEYLVK